MKAKGLVLLSALAVTLSTVAVPLVAGSTAYAETNAAVNTGQEETLGERLAAHAEVAVDGDTATIAFADEDVLEALLEAGYFAPEAAREHKGLLKPIHFSFGLPPVGGATTNGRTKIVVKSLLHGDADIYVSRNILSAIAGAQVGATVGSLTSVISAALLTLLPGIPGLTGTAWGSAIGSVSGAIAATVASHRYEQGKIYQIRHFVYQGHLEQWKEEE